MHANNQTRAMELINSLEIKGPLPSKNFLKAYLVLKSLK